MVICVWLRENMTFYILASCKKFEVVYLIKWKEKYQDALNLPSAACHVLRSCSRDDIFSYLRKINANFTAVVKYKVSMRLHAFMHDDD